MEDKVKWPLAITSLRETGRKPKPAAGGGRRGGRQEGEGGGQLVEGHCPRLLPTDRARILWLRRSWRPEHRKRGEPRNGVLPDGKTPGATGEFGLHVTENGEQLVLFMPLNLFGEKM